MGRDEHRKPKGKKALAQTPKNQIVKNVDVEFSEQFADVDDREAQARARAADQRAKKG